MDSGRDFLTSLQFSDYFFPIGTYTFSYGLESFVQKGIVKDGKTLNLLIKDYLRHQIGPCDMVALINVHDAAGEGDLERIIEIDDRLFSLKLVKETRESSIKSGRQFLDLMIRTREQDILKKLKSKIEKSEAWGNYATILGVTTQLSGIPRKEASLILAYTFTIGLLGASMRLLRLGHSEIQSILEETKGVILDVHQENQAKTEDEMRSFCPYIDIMGMIHERSDLRLFFS